MYRATSKVFCNSAHKFVMFDNGRQILAEFKSTVRRAAAIKVNFFICHFNNALVYCQSFAQCSHKVDHCIALTVLQAPVFCQFNAFI